MAATKRKIGIYTVAGITIAGIIIASLLFSGLNPLSNQESNKAMGTLIVSVKDAPVELERLDLTIASIYVQGGNDESWTELQLIEDVPQPFNLLALKDISLELSQTQLPVGDYNKVRLEVSDAVATYPDQTTLDLKIPPGHIDIIAKFTISEYQQTKLLIDIQPDTTAISHSGNFRPVIKATVTSAGATITPSPTPSQSPTQPPPT
jgi:hypothetical protein